MWITTNCGKFLKKWGYQTTLPASWEIYKKVEKQQLEMGMEQWTGSKIGKEYIKAIYCHSPYLTTMWSASCEMLGWMKHKLWIQDCQEKYQQYLIPSLWYPESRMEVKSHLMKVKEESEKTALKSTFKKWRSWHLVSSLHSKQMEKQWKQWWNLFSWAPKSLLMVTEPMNLKDTYSLEERLWQT